MPAVNAQLVAVPDILNRLLVGDMQHLGRVPNNNSNNQRPATPTRNMLRDLMTKLQSPRAVTNNLQLIGDFLKRCQKLKPTPDDLMVVRRIVTVHQVYGQVHDVLQQVVADLPPAVKPTQLVVATVHRRFKSLQPLLQQDNEYLALLQRKTARIITSNTISQLSGLEFEVDNLLKNYVHCLLNRQAGNDKTNLRLSWFMIASKVSHRFFRI